MRKYLILKVSQTLETNCHIFGKTTSYFLKLEKCSDLETFLCVSPWQKKLIGDVIFNFC